MWSSCPRSTASVCLYVCVNEYVCLCKLYAPIRPAVDFKVSTLAHSTTVWGPQRANETSQPATMTAGKMMAQIN